MTETLIAPDADARSARLTAARRTKMARSAHAYVRGSTAQFYDWLAESGARLPDGPPVWICGDCHLGNLGPLANRKGKVAIQVRDLDQTVIGNPAHDLIRLGLSLASSARGSDLPGVTTARMLEALMSGYEGALTGDESARVRRPPEIRKLLGESLRRRWRHLADDRLGSSTPAFPTGRRFWPLERDETLAIAALFTALHPADLNRLTGVSDPDSVEVVDAAYWMKGCSSLGRLRYAVMVRAKTADGVRHRLLDLKEAVTTLAPRASERTMPRDNAERVVAGARALSPHLGDRMVAARLLGRPVVLRELAPQDLKIELATLRPERAVALAGYLGAIIGKAHGRQMSAEDRVSWHQTLQRARPAGLDAPTWLWASVVDLLSVHEAAYLEHCRKFALSAA